MTKKCYYLTDIEELLHKNKTYNQKNVSYCNKNKEQILKFTKHKRKLLPVNKHWVKMMNH